MSALVTQQPHVLPDASECAAPCWFKLFKAHGLEKNWLRLANCFDKLTIAIKNALHFPSRFFDADAPPGEVCSAKPVQ
ncbi:hypothetical protein D3C80_1905600 [compost metagenome]